MLGITDLEDSEPESVLIAVHGADPGPAGNHRVVQAINGQDSH